ALHPQPLVLAAQLHQFLPLVPCERPCGTPPGFHFGLLNPASQCRLPDAQFQPQLSDALAAVLDQPHRLGFVLFREFPPPPPLLLLHRSLLSRVLSRFSECPSNRGKSRIAIT